MDSSGRSFCLLYYNYHLNKFANGNNLATSQLIKILKKIELFLVWKKPSRRHLFLEQHLHKVFYSGDARTR